MITVSISGKEIVVRPKHLLDYVEKLDFIKSRRVQPYDLLRDWPQEKGQKGATQTEALIRIAMETVYTRSSSVSPEEELFFDTSEEGFCYDLWRCIRQDPNEPFRKGINDTKHLFFVVATEEEKSRLRLALEAVDESHNLKNSDGPSVK